MNIYLIGLPGVGKSTIGKKLAEAMNYHYIDLDNYIEQQAMLFIDELFVLYGEEYFRALESNCLKEVSQMTDVVISCGGGIVKMRSNKEHMKGICIYLTAPIDILEERVEQQEAIRPLLQTKTMSDLYQERKSAYEAFADWQIENTDVESTLKEILTRLEVQ